MSSSYAGPVPRKSNILGSLFMLYGRCMHTHALEAFKIKVLPGKIIKPSFFLNKQTKSMVTPLMSILSAPCN